MFNELTHISGAGRTSVHEIVGMQWGNLGASNGKSFQTSSLDELPCCARPILLLPARPCRILEDAAAAPLVEGRPSLPPLEHLRDRCIELSLLFRLQAHSCVEHDPPIQTAAPIGEWYVVLLENLVPASCVHDSYALHYFRPVSPMTAGVHIDAPTDGARHTYEDVQPGIARFCATAGGEQRRRPPPQRPPLARL